MTVRATSAAIREALQGYEPSEEQWEVIGADLEPVAIVAGAGSGKTAVMAARIIHLVESSLVRPADVLGLTFTNKAAGELEERLAVALDALEPPTLEHPTVMTYHALAQHLVRDHGPRIGIEPEASLLSDAQKWQLLLDLVDEFPSFEEVELRHPLSFIPQTLSLADGCANHLVDPEELEKACRDLEHHLNDEYALRQTRKRADFAKILRSYTDRKRALRRIDFGDQIRLAVEILERHSEVAASLRRRFPVVLLDEYQDTNPAQKVMLQHLCPPGSAVTAVGDARQTIYAWRGASMYNLIRFNEEFPRADGSPSRMASLSLNFRSGRRIVELANRLISPVSPERRPGADLVPTSDNGEAWVGVGLFSDQEAEAEFVAEEITRLQTEGRAWRDFAILVRKKRYMDRIVAALERRDIPVEMPELGGLLKIPAVIDVIAWLQVLAGHEPSTNRWAARILMGPRFRIHYRDIARVARWAVQRNFELMAEARELLGVDDPDPGQVAYSLMEALHALDEIEEISEEARTRVAEFLGVLEELRPLCSATLQELVQAVVDRTGLGEALLASTSRTAVSMRENLNGFVGWCAEFAPLEGDANLGTFLEFLDVAEESEDPIPLAATASTNSVKVMTVHGAKGLEFETVFLPVLAASQEHNRFDGFQRESVFPDVRASSPLSSTTELPPSVRQDSEFLPRFEGSKSRYITELKQRAEEDERRLFYVAVTRAKQRLYCTAAHWYGTDERKGPSAFLKEVAQHTDLVEVVCNDQPSEDNPVLAGLRESLAWPPSPARMSDEVVALLAGVETMLHGGASPSGLDAEAQALFEEHRSNIEALSAHPEPADEPAPTRRTVAATKAAEFLADSAPAEKGSPLGRRPTDAQRLGIEVHSWIEELHRGLVGLADEEAGQDASLIPDPATVEGMKESFRRMGFEERRPHLLASGEPATELPFALKAGDTLIRGRVDAVYQPLEGEEELEIVDFKTGSEPSQASWTQLELYAEALCALGLVSGEVKLTYAFLRTGRCLSTRYSPRGTARLAAHLSSRLTS